MSTCWLCDRDIDDPPRVIGRILAGETRLAHIECLRFVGEIELGLRPRYGGPPVTQPGPGTFTHETFPGRP